MSTSIRMPLRGLAGAGLGYVPLTNSSLGGQEARTRIRELDAAVSALMADVQARVDVIAAQESGTAFIRNFAAFQGEWITWRDEHEDAVDLFFGALFYTIGAQLGRFIDRYNGFEEKYRRVTGEQPSVPGGAERPILRDSGGLPGWAWALIAVGGVAVTGGLVWGVARVMREGRLLTGAGA